MRPDLWHPLPGLQAHRSPGKQRMQPRSRMQPESSQHMVILGQGGSWEDAGKVSVGREGGGFSAHDYVSQALWMPPRAQDCHKEEHTRHRTPTSARSAAEASWGQARVWGSRLQSQRPQWAGRACVYLLCPNSSDFSIRRDSEQSWGQRGIRSPPEGRWRTGESIQSLRNDS